MVSKYTRKVSKAESAAVSSNKPIKMETLFFPQFYAVKKYSFFGLDDYLLSNLQN